MTDLVKPRVFISSTIFDFSDLRSSIKYWLEQEGYEVSASEFNDFRKEVQLNSYDACLKAIDSCQYFILLIGTRAGGLMPAPPQTTITMAEYRHAYKRATKGEIKIITLVRRSVWNTKEDRQALGNIIKHAYQDENKISDEQLNSIKHHSSKVVQDAELIFRFLSEVCRLDEMKTSIKENKPAPLKNWTHQFDNFREIIDVLKNTFARNNRGLRSAVLLANLETELTKNLTLLLRKTATGELRPHYLDASPGRHAYNGLPNSQSVIPRKDLAALAFVAFSPVRAITSPALEQCVNSGVFLDYVFQKDRYETGAVQKAFLKLQDSTRLIKDLSEIGSPGARSILDKLRTDRTTQHIEIDNNEVASLVALHDHLKNAVDLSLAILKYIQSGVSEFPEVAPVNLFIIPNENGAPSFDDIGHFSSQYKPGQFS